MGRIEYTVCCNKVRGQPVWLAFWLRGQSALDKVLGRFDTEGEARAACDRHAMQGDQAQAPRDAA